jgi:hypothetical protein
MEKIMNRSRIAVIAAAASFACAATGAAAAVAYYPDGYVVYDPAPARTVRFERVTAPEIVTYDDRYVYYSATEGPALVERTYVAPGETVVVQADPLVVTGPAREQWNPRHPHWGHLIDYGLFNRTGPNDFGR